MSIQPISPASIPEKENKIMITQSEINAGKLRMVEIIIQGSYNAMNDYNNCLKEGVLTEGAMQTHYHTILHNLAWSLVHFKNEVTGVFDSEKHILGNIEWYFASWINEVNGKFDYKEVALVFAKTNGIISE